MVEFAKRLPEARERMIEDLSTDGLNKRRVLAAAGRLLDLGFFRIGGEEYAETNQSYGLATMHKEHVHIDRDGVMTFDYTAKSGKHRIQQIVEPELSEIVGQLKRRRGGGPELLVWREGAGRGAAWHDVRSGDINDYLGDVTGGEFTAKDFRTWHATVLCSVALAVSSEVPSSESARKRAISRAIKETSIYLGNTPAVCRASYIDPRVIDAFTDGITIWDDLDRLGADTSAGELATAGPIEVAVLELLRDPAASKRRHAAARKRTVKTAA